MARVYQQQTTTPDLRGVQQPRARAPEVSDAMPRAIDKLSRGLGQAIEVFAEREESQAKAWAADALADARLQWAANMRQRQLDAQPGAPEFTPTVLSDFDEFSDKALETAPTATAKAFLQGRLKDLRNELAEKSIEFEATARVQYIETAHNKGIDKASVLMTEDPTQYKAALAEQVELIRVSAMGPQKKLEMTTKAINRISGAAVWSQINDSPTAFLQTIGLYPDKDGKVNGDLKGVTGNMAFNALEFDDRVKYYNLAVSEKARIDREAEDAIGGRTVKSTDATLRRLYELIGSDPLEAERFAFEANQRGALSQDDFKQGVSKARDQARTIGPKSEYERSRNYVIQSLEPGPMVTDPAKRARLAEAIDMFDRWVVTGPAKSDQEIYDKGREVVKRFALLDMRETIVALPQPKNGEINRGADPAAMGAQIMRIAEGLQQKRALGVISQREYEEDMEVLNRWHKAVGQ